MFYSQVILAKKGPLAKVWLAAHWGDKKLARPQIFATDIAQSVDTIVNPTMPLALRMSGHLLLGVVRIYSRKVKYVLSDCTEAMLKLQMAFATAQTKGKELLETTGGGGGTTTNNNNTGGYNSNSNNIHNPNNTSHVVNFGDYEQIHVVEGFCLPMPDNSEWIVADDDDDDDDVNTNNNNNEGKRRSVGGGSSMLAASQSPEARYQPPTEETWVPFDPENEDDEDEEFHSRVSDVELARAAGDSFLSGDETRRGSSIVEKSPVVLERPENGPHDEEEPMDFAYVPFQEDDDEEDQQQQQQQQSDPTNDDSLLRLSTSNTPDVSGLSSPGLDDSHDADAGSSSLKRGAADGDAAAADGSSPSKRKRRKRRKVIVDNDHTELTNEHIKAMLADTSDIVKRMRHPADVQDDDEVEETKYSTFVPILTQPFLADDGHLHPELLHLWQNNFYRALDRPCPFEMRETIEDVEQARQAPATDDEDDEEGSKASNLELAAAPIPMLQEEEEEEPDDFAPPPMDDDEEEEEEDPINPSMDSESEQEVGTNFLRGSIGDLGLMNELQLADDEDEEEREAVGEHVGTKWHQHTVKVLKLLQSRIRGDDDDEDDDGESEDRATTPTSLEFGDLAKNVNRRTAASCFIECLQLKTWDFVELAQDDEYGPITISAGPRFLEQPPNEA